MSDAIGMISVFLVFYAIAIWAFRRKTTTQEVPPSGDSARPLFKIFSIILAVLFGVPAPLVFLGGPDAKFGILSMVSGLLGLGAAIFFIFLAKRLS